MQYPQAISYLESLTNYENVPSYQYQKSLGLNRIKGFLDTIDNPQNGFKSIHIAGTKGKGSTCAFIAYILKEKGYKVGLYTSPHLNDLSERIRVLPGFEKGEFEGIIPKVSLKSIVKKLKPKIERYNRISPYGQLTAFEVYTTIAFIYFKEMKVDFAVLETGLGGRLDATNIVNALVSVITPISYEHMDKLGKRLKEIAGEKAGIIKNKGSLVISAPQEKEAEQVIRARCRVLNAKLYGVDKYRNLKLKLLGRHQLVNAAVAIKTVQMLSFYGINVGNKIIRRGLYNTLWPGRCEVIYKRPFIVLDGAQNVASALAIKKAIIDNFSYNKLILILGVSSDKDIKGICSSLNDFADTVILTKSNNPRAADPENLAKYFSGKKIFVTKCTREARRLAQNIAKKRDLILVTGSLFVVGEFKYNAR
jgi:dihydrofolate synthase/folylpolyglutamate synthase